MSRGEGCQLTQNKAMYAARATKTQEKHPVSLFMEKESSHLSPASVKPLSWLHLSKHSHAQTIPGKEHIALLQMSGEQRAVLFKKQLGKLIIPFREVRNTHSQRVQVTVMDLVSLSDGRNAADLIFLDRKAWKLQTIMIANHFC
ncbi:unnamed protein product [Lepidochelys olivacea]